MPICWAIFFATSAPTLASSKSLVKMTFLEEFPAPLSPAHPETQIKLNARIPARMGRFDFIRDIFVVFQANGNRGAPGSGRASLASGEGVKAWRNSGS